MYIGFYQTKCTSKNQLTFPSKLVEQTGEKLMITSWFENSLIVLPYETGEQLLNIAIEDATALLPEARDLKRFFFGNATVVGLDNKNRFVLPQNLKEYSRIGNEAIFIGVSERIELWDRKLYENYGKIREAQIRKTALMHYERIQRKVSDE